MQRSVHTTRAQEPLTGNYIHNRYIDAYRQIVARNPKTPLFCRFWTELDGERVEAYNLIAAQITAHFLAPLQGRVTALEQENAAFQARIATLEQENVELETQITESAIQREDLEQEVAGLQDDADESMSLAFNVTMTAIQADKRIQALLALVREYRDVLDLRPPVLAYGCDREVVDSWRERVTAVFKHTQEVLNTSTQGAQ